MSCLAPSNAHPDDALQRLLRERLAGDDEAVRRVESLIRALRAEQWASALPAPASPRGVPHS